MHKLLLAVLFAGSLLPPQAAELKVLPWNGFKGAVSLTFDDGDPSHLDVAIPEMDRRKVRGTFFVITARMGNVEPWKQAAAAGHEIGSHTANHAFLPSLDSAVAENELKTSKKRLEEILGHPVTLFSYPAGGFTSRIRALVEEVGYIGAVTTNHGKEKKDPYALHRVKMSESGGSLFNFWAKISGLYQTGKKRAVAADMNEGSGE